MSSVAGGVVGTTAVFSGAGGGAPLHVLAVDDSSVDRAVISGILRSSRFRVTAVDSGKRALELLGSEPNVSMIITDYWMPEMTGYELLKKVKMLGGRRRGFPDEARPAVGRVAGVQPGAPMRRGGGGSGVGGDAEIEGLNNSVHDLLINNARQFRFPSLARGDTRGSS
ncbi:Two-component response regulator ARR6 [Triticum urartu]|uniref:Response regulatory domain-containing protein n=2 Tax=Triticum TaxID=4564 RepID=A0A9R0Y1I1_TRITD|nr:Two-component response regulator ARR6 [Triticum urartu]VAI46969.1 unnamed protein product [Triticum turgidum subsp. durum]